MKKIGFVVVAVVLVAVGYCQGSFGPLTPSAKPYERTYIWPDGKMPDVQPYQIAAKSGEKKSTGFKADDFRRPYIDWYAPNPDCKTDLCVMTVSGGGFNSCCDAERLRPAIDRFVKAGITVADVTYRTPRPKGLPIHQSAWEDVQRAVRVVRSEAVKRGFKPEKIGATGISAGSKALLLVATSSLTPAYPPVDEIDKLPCNLLFAIPQAPAYVLTDGQGTPNTRDGDAPDVKLVPELKFDAKTCPMCFFQGGIDEYSPFGTTQIYRQLRRMKIPAEVHLFADRWHGFHGDMNKGDDATGWDHWFHRAEEFIRQMNYDGRRGGEVSLMSRFADDSARGAWEKEDIWPAGRMPPGCTNQCTPFVEWHIPKELKTKAVQIIFSGGGYHWNQPEGMEVTPGLWRSMMPSPLRMRRDPSGRTSSSFAWKRGERPLLRGAVQGRGQGARPGPHRDNGRLGGRAPRAHGGDVVAAQVVLAGRRDRQAALQGAVGRGGVSGVFAYGRRGLAEQERRQRGRGPPCARVLVRPRHVPGAVPPRRRRRLFVDGVGEGVGAAAPDGRAGRGAHLRDARALLPEHGRSRHRQLHISRPHLGVHEPQGVQQVADSR